MDQQQQSRWRTIGKWILWAVCIGIALVVLIRLIRIGYAYQWTGFGQAKVSEAVEPSKTLWDWLDLLIVPVVLAVGGYLFTRSESHATRATEEQRAQEEALQAYLQEMGELVLEHDLHNQDPKEDQPWLYDTAKGDIVYTKASTRARARTLSILDRVAPKRKRIVLQTLYESALIGHVSPLEQDFTRPVVDLNAADLTDAELAGMNLSGARLTGADLSGADLRGAVLERADLSNAGLRGADLSNAHLGKAFLAEADLRRANLKGADLSNADLHGANLRRAKGITEVQLENQADCLQGATMPNGQKYEDWLKDKEDRGEDAENSENRDSS